MAVITGASAGIGAAFACLLAARGHDCVLVGRRAGALDTLAAEIAQSGARPHVVALDLGMRDGPDRLARELDARALSPAIIINNAGFGLRGDAACLDHAQQLEMIDLNVRTLTDLSLRFVDSLANHRGGLINVASMSAFFPGPGMAVYFACKAYVLSLSEALHRELQPRGIRVTVVCPGPVPTEFQARAGLDPDLPRLFTRSAARIARDGYDGFMRGERLIVPGVANKVAALVPRLLPRAVVLWMVATHQMKAAKPPKNREQ